MLVFISLAVSSSRTVTQLTRVSQVCRSSPSRQYLRLYGRRCRKLTCGPSGIARKKMSNWLRKHPLLASLVLFNGEQFNDVALLCKCSSTRDTTIGCLHPPVL